jgi:hypothetical protein
MQALPAKIGLSGISGISGISDRERGGLHPSGETVKHRTDG